MKTQPMDAKIVDVMRHDTGEKVGTFDMGTDWWEMYSEQRHPMFQWPAGTVRASAFLFDQEIKDMGIDRSTVIFLQE